MEKNNIKKRFIQSVLRDMKTNDCRKVITDNSFLLEEEYQYSFNLKEQFNRCGTSRVILKIQQKGGFSSIIADAYDGDSFLSLMFEQRRQSTWEEYDDFADLTVQDVVCVAELRIYEDSLGGGNEEEFSIRWESIIAWNDNTYMFSGDIRTGINGVYSPPICDSESRFHISDIRQKKLLHIKSLYGNPVSEGVIHSKIWENEDGKLQGYDDHLLSELFTASGLILVSVRITEGLFLPGWDDSREYDSLTRSYLRAEAIAYKDEDYYPETDYDYAVFSFRARYVGTEEQWAQLKDSTVSDIIIRASFAPWEDGDEELSYYEPLWVAAISGEKTISLGGERIDYADLDAKAQRIFEKNQCNQPRSSQDDHYELVHGRRRPDLYSVMMGLDDDPIFYNDDI